MDMTAWELDTKLANLARELHSTRKLSPTQIRQRAGFLDSNDQPAPAFIAAPERGASGAVNHLPHFCKTLVFLWHGVSGQLLDCTQKAWFRIYQVFNVRQDIPGIYQVYTRYILYIYHAKVTCYKLLASLVAHARLAASDRDFPRIFSVLATERPPTLGWGCPKFQNQVLIW